MMMMEGDVWIMSNFKHPAIDRPATENCQYWIEGGNFGDL